MGTSASTARSCRSKILALVLRILRGRVVEMLSFAVWELCESRSHFQVRQEVCGDK